jgi:hypothetical protein
VPEEEANNRHDALEHAEDQYDAEPQLPVDSGDANGGRRSEIVEAHRQRDEK